MTTTAITFQDWRCRVVRGIYEADRSIALNLVGLEDGQPIATATLCLADYGFSPPPGHCFIKDYAENQGILDALTEAKVIEFTGIVIPLAFAQAHLCKVLIQ